MSRIYPLLVLLLCCLLMTSKLIINEALSNSPDPFSSIEDDIAPTLDRIENPVCVVTYSEENYGGSPTCLRAGQYLDPSQIAQILKFKSLRVPKGVLLQLSGDNAVSASVNSESSIPTWTPPPWPVMEILVLRLALIGEKCYGDVPGPVEKVSDEISPGPNDVLTKLSDPSRNASFFLLKNPSTTGD